MKFFAGPAPKKADSSFCDLTADNWNDFGYKTLFILTIRRPPEEPLKVGAVKIARIGMEGNDDFQTKLPDVFEVLPEGFFSLGQEDEYYEALSQLEDETREAILTGLRDIAFSPLLFQKVREENVTATSLLRFVSEENVKGQFWRMANGGARLTPYRFSYGPDQASVNGNLPPVLDFEVRPESRPPSNVHVLIGRNGVGKTQMLHSMARSLTVAGPDQVGFGRFTFARGEEPNIFTFEPVPEKSGVFSNLVSVMFSAFDPFLPLLEMNDPKSEGIRYSYVGLSGPSTKGTQLRVPRDHTELAEDFADSVQNCLVGGRHRRWRRALEVLESDPLFKAYDVVGLASHRDSKHIRKEALTLFKNLSSGHKIVLLTITKLVELTEEKTLVLMDEPEAHLHPPLLSSFVRTLSDLLINRNGVAIIATHSPVILQEVPRRCVWKLRRSGGEVAAARPDLETFGENVGILTNEIFGLELTQSGFHQLIREAVGKRLSYEQVIEHFGGQLGSESRAIIRALIATRETDELI